MSADKAEDSSFPSPEACDIITRRRILARLREYLDAGFRDPELLYLSALRCSAAYGRRGLPVSRSSSQHGLSLRYAHASLCSRRTTVPQRLNRRAEAAGSGVMPGATDTVVR